MAKHICSERTTNKNLQQCTSIALPKTIGNRHNFIPWTLKSTLYLYHINKIMSNLLRLVLFPFVGLALLVSSCIKKDDLYTGTGKEESTLFEGDVVLPSGFNWESSKAVDVRIPVDDKYNGKYFYRVELYDADPKSATANLLGAGVAKSGQDYVDKVMVPTALEYVYLKKTSPVGIAAISMIEVANVNSVDLTNVVGSGTSNKAISSVSDAKVASGTSDSVVQMASTTSSSSITVPADAIELVGNNTYGWSDVNNHKSFVVKAGQTFTGSVALNSGIGGIKVYVEGTWEHSSIMIGAANNVGNAVYVLPGGKVKVNDLSQSQQGFFENYGTMEVANNLSGNNPVTFKNFGNLTVNNSLTIPSGGAFYNAGTIHVKDLTPNSSTTLTNEGILTITGKLSVPSEGSFLNNGTASVATLTADNSSGFIKNEGSLTVQTGTITNATVEAACHTTFETLTTNGANFYVSGGALLKVGNLDAGGTKFNLASSSILDVTTLAKFNSNTSTIQGTGSSEAVARLKKVESHQASNGGIIYSGNLEIACSDYTPNGQYNIYYTLTAPAYIVDYDKSTVKIASTECNAGGNNDAGAGINPGDQTIPKVSLGTYSYAFEDNWPSFGDYDMNDFVVDIDITKFQSTDNKVTKMELKAKLRSVGATNRLAAAIQLDGVLAGNVKGVTYSNQHIIGENFVLESNGVETAQTYAVVPICDDAHQAFGKSEPVFISTKDGSNSPVEVLITIEFNTSLASFTYDGLNVFIVTGGYKNIGRTEVHLPNYAATDKINTSLVSAEISTGQLSAGDPFKSSNGSPWAICVPVSFDYPNEWKKITGIYPKFSDWAISGGQLYKDWYIK